MSRDLILYVRAGCHLCTDMLRDLEGLRTRIEFRYIVMDVDAEADLAARYGDRVPVLTANDTEICHYFLDEDCLRTYLESA